MNQVSLIGNLTKDIEVRANQNGTLITSFCLAVRRDNENTDFINCKAFNKTADLLAKYTHKGSKIGVSGRIQTGNYQNQEGKTIYTTDVMVNRIYLLDSKAQQAEQENAKEESENVEDFNPNDWEVLDEESLPF